MGYGKNMKQTKRVASRIQTSSPQSTAGKRLVDVLDTPNPIDKTFWDKMFAKLSLLQAKIENYKGPSMSIDDTEYRWVTNRLEYWNSEERLLNKNEMTIANEMWKKYGK